MTLFALHSWYLSLVTLWTWGCVGRGACSRLLWRREEESWESNPRAIMCAVYLKPGNSRTTTTVMPNMTLVYMNSFTHTHTHEHTPSHTHLDTAHCNIFFNIPAHYSVTKNWYRIFWIWIYCQPPLFYHQKISNTTVYSSVLKLKRDETHLGNLLTQAAAIFILDKLTLYEPHPYIVISQLTKLAPGGW